MQPAGSGRATGHCDRAAAFLSFPRGGICADSFIISPLNNAWDAKGSPKSCRGDRMFFHDSFLLGRRWGDGKLNKNFLKISLRSKDGKHSLEDFVSSWGISGGAFLGVVSENALWALVLHFPSCNRNKNKSWGSSCCHTSPQTRGPVEGLLGVRGALGGSGTMKIGNWRALFPLQA